MTDCPGYGGRWRVREGIDGFATLAEMGIVLHLDGNIVEDLEPYVVFIPC